MTENKCTFFGHRHPGRRRYVRFFISRNQNNLAGNPGSPLKPRRRHQLHIMVCLRLFERKTRLPHHTGKRPRHYFGFDYIYH